MGAALVRAVFVYWVDLDPMPKIMLVYMANRALDNDHPPLFYGGRVELALSIGRVLPDAPAYGDHSDAAEAVRRLRHDGFKAAERTLRVLRDRRAVRPLNRPGPGRRAVYELLIVPGAGVQQPPQLITPGKVDAKVPPAEWGAGAPHWPGGTFAKVPPAEWTSAPHSAGALGEIRRRKSKEEEEEEGSPESPPHLPEMIKKRRPADEAIAEAMANGAHKRAANTSQTNVSDPGA